MKFRLYPYDCFMRRSILICLVLTLLILFQTSTVADSPIYEQARISLEMTEIVMSCLDLYKKMDSAPGLNGLLCLPNAEETALVAKRIADLGYTVMHPNGDLYHYEAVLSFCEAVNQGTFSEVNIYFVQNNLSCLSFFAENGRVFFVVNELRFDEELNPVIAEDGILTELELFTLTDKGYLIYGKDKMPQGKFVFKFGFRVKPLGEKLRELERVYLEPLGGYAGHNALTENWSARNVTSLNFNEIFEPLYNYESGRIFDEDFMEPYSYDNGSYMQSVPGDLFERIVTKYFPVSVEELRANAVYSTEQEIYAGEAMWREYYYNPAWEVVDYYSNADGSLTLVVDAVSIPHGKDRVATNYLTVMPREDGTFYYLSNTCNRFYRDWEKVNLWPYFPEYGARVK